MLSSFRKWIYKGQCNKLHSNRIFRIKWITWTSIILIHSFITVCFLVLLHFTEVFTARLISFTNQTSNHFTYQCIPSGSNVVVLPRYSPLSMCTPPGPLSFLPSIDIQICQVASYWLHCQTIRRHIWSHCCAHFALHLTSPAFGYGKCLNAASDLIFPFAPNIQMIWARCLAFASLIFENLHELYVFYWFSFTKVFIKIGFWCVFYDCVYLIGHLVSDTS